jgi:hypothetical protein
VLQAGAFAVASVKPVMAVLDQAASALVVCVCEGILENEMHGSVFRRLVLPREIQTCLDECLGITAQYRRHRAELQAIRRTAQGRRHEQAIAAVKAAARLLPPQPQVQQSADWDVRSSDAETANALRRASFSLTDAPQVDSGHPAADYSVPLPSSGAQPQPLLPDVV